jgi:hypothetical protein
MRCSIAVSRVLTDFAFRASALVVCLLIASATILWADWIEDGNPLCMEPGNQTEARIVSDGAGGAIIVWEDERNGIYTDIYAQRIDAIGNVLWMEGGIPICTGSWHVDRLRMVPDGLGGAIIVWRDERSGYSDYDIYAQRIDDTGTTRWATNGLAVCTATEFWPWPVVAPDGSGGAIIAWEDDRGEVEDIYVQRIDASGAPLWGTNGMPICTDDRSQSSPEIVSDGIGGAIIAWVDDRYDYDIFAQRVDSNGVALWDEGGIAVHLDEDFNSYIQIASDGAEGALISWATGVVGGYNVYAQRVDSTGTLKWATEGVCVSAAPGRQWFRQGIVCDGEEGAIITFWQDDDDITYWNIYAQRIDSAGVVRWDPSGVEICTEIWNQTNPKITSDGAGGAIITWEDGRYETDDIYAQRIDSTGAVQWEYNGVPVCSRPGGTYGPYIVSDGAGWGAIVTWNDTRTGEYDIYAKYISGPPHPDYSSIEPWDTYGSALVVPGTGTFPDSVTVTVRDELGAPVRHAEVELDFSGCIELCIDTPDGFGDSTDVYGTVVLDPRVGGCSSGGVSVLANGFEIRYYTWVKSPDWDGVWANGEVDGQDYGYIYSMWGSSDDCADLNSDGVVGVTDLNIYLFCEGTSNDVVCPNYLCEVSQTAFDLDTVLTGTEHERTFAIRNLGGYPVEGYVEESCLRFEIISGGEEYSIPLRDSLGGHLCTDVTFTAYAIDTIPPPVPTGFEVAFNTGSGNELLWDSLAVSDLGYYNVYRSDKPGLVQPDTLDTDWAVVYSTLDTFWTDSSPDAWRYRYRLSAVDHVSNESDFAYPETVTGDDTPQVPEQFTLYQNIPNPFNPVTTILFDVPRRTMANLAVYDVQGRLVRVLVDGPVDAGQKSVSWDGRNSRGTAVASGIYFYRLATPEFGEARKMILLR